MSKKLTTDKYEIARKINIRYFEQHFERSLIWSDEIPSYYLMINTSKIETTVYRDYIDVRIKTVASKSLSAFKAKFRLEDCTGNHFINSMNYLIDTVK